MTRFIRYGVVPAGIILVLLTATAILVPALVKVERFVPAIEQRLSAATGRTFAIGPDLVISCFPWLSVSFSNLKIGNPPGFTTDDFVNIESFEGRISILPLFWKKVQFSRFVVGGLSVNLERNDAGRVNWQFDRSARDSGGSDCPASAIGALLNGYAFDLFAVTDGRIDWVDRPANVRHRIEEVMVLARNVGAGRPVSLDFKASLDNRPIALEGQAGPFQDHGGQRRLPVDLGFTLVDLLQGKMRGEITVTGQHRPADFQLALQLAPFSPRAFFSAMQLPFPLAAAPESFTSFDLDLVVRGHGDGIEIDKGSARLDDTKLSFTLAAEPFRQPKVTFSVNLDRLDLDRYLPPAMGHQSAEAESGPHWPAVEVAGDVSLGEMKLHGATATDLAFSVHGKDGIFTADPATMAFYRGRFDGALTLNVQGEQPALRLTAKGREIDAEPLLRDFGGWGYLRGTVGAELDLQWVEADAKARARTLAGRGTLLIRDGALLGVDLAGGAGSAATIPARPETGFTEAQSAFTIDNGLLESRETSLTGPALGLRTSGTADLGSGRLNLRLELDRPASMQGGGGLYRVTGILPEVEMTVAGPGDAGIAAGPDGSASVESLIARKLPSPIEGGGTNLVGRDLVDPEVVAQRFRLQRETIPRREMKKKYPLGRGRVQIGPLREEASLH